jgi:hypothetical protein
MEASLTDPLPMKCHPERATVSILNNMGDQINWPLTSHSLPNLDFRVGRKFQDGNGDRERKTSHPTRTAFAGSAAPP